MSESEVAAEPQAVPGPGAVLRMAREARGMAITEAAAALKMSPRQIEAIEAEDFSRLPGATFVRGFIRNYARLLKIDAAPVLGALPEQAAPLLAELNMPKEAGVKMPSGNARQGRGILGATMLALIVLGMALALYFDAIDLTALQASRQGSGQAVPARQEAPQVAQPQPQALPAGDPPAAEAAATPSEKPAESSVDTGGQQLIFSFDGSAWVEVKDASGRTVFSQMNARGTTQVVGGRPPFQLVVGNASQVRLQYKDQPVDLRPHTRVEVARLTLE
ncbi:MAG: Cytoskeleton protein RodZ [Rhodocyclaceae bacterium]|nr:MAG: helix-turn-helix domain-containing protein [Rhodocyclaceae bacterium]MBE7421556.1 helix-turn-helix domain-containing protein [Zoogloeaceae bacterium]MBV6408774.1 Cytoskeleton protein RodZ [Rhodocyclaceae bacterium]CAG0932660.1 Cytoskeleton protein RodZ [Rhodocyclaceae bacterium]